MSPRKKVEIERFSFDRLIEFSGVTFAEASRVLAKKGFTIYRQQWARWRRDGIPEMWADRLACGLGWLPWVIWPEWLERGLAMADAHDADRRRMASERAKAYQARNREAVREKDKERARSRNREIEAFKQRVRRAAETPEQAEERRERERIRKSELRAAKKVAA